MKNAAIAIALALVAQSVGAEWVTSQVKDEMTDEPTFTLTLAALDSSKAGLLVMCSPGGQAPPHLVLSWGQFMGFPGDKTSTLTYRFDDQPARDGYGRLLSDGRLMLLLVNTEFRQKLLAASSYKVRMADSLGASVTLTFDVTGAAEAFAPVLAACGL